MSVPNLLLNKHNPDVLTCIANLSNDEVFTPPEMAAAMLDLAAEAWARDHNGENLWANPNARVLDPFVKTGVFLREATHRFNDGLASLIPDPQERVNHILTKQIFGIAITELTALMARRSVYCSKYANSEHSICTAFDTPEGNIWFERTEHTWDDKTGTRESRVDPLSGEEIFVRTGRRCSYCGAGEEDYGRGEELETHAYAFIHTNNIYERINEIFGANMHFDLIVGNPPYQLSDGGGSGSSAVPIYHRFIEQAKNLDPELITMIIPSRWFTGGKGLSAFRKAMLTDDHLTDLVDYPNSRDVFDGVDIAGGVCYFLRGRLPAQMCKVTTITNGHEFVEYRRLDEYESFVRDNRTLRIIRKVDKQKFGTFSEIVSARRPFGIDSSFTGSVDGDLYLFSSSGDARINRADVPKGHALIDTWRVLLSKSSSEHAGQTDKSGRKRVLSRIEVMPPGSVSTESYLIIGPFSSENEAHNAAEYMRTRFFRYLVSAILITQNISRASFIMVPQVDLSQRWDDRDLYERFNLSADEIELIEQTIKPIGEE
ncbi:Eco57I restriction-modification methylase domain-containing protein [Schaalia suimastitidis]|uniref:Eco57I restriction-modification methylase domain-containing protein n=1 Tax=Schaalia suimastitidis TaxID=121163 RepID=UPI0004233FE9|nr:Eco57I restriction-modification methylase domain-containing protein [Schaalia suimastitidis]